MIELPDITEEAAALPHAKEAIALLSSGGDARIVLDPETGLNRYLSAPYPRSVLAYASSTANDLSRDAFAHVCGRIADGLSDYPEALDEIRGRIRHALGLEENKAIAFAASGTDLEYLPICAVAQRSTSGVHNILLGADEVGSGCSLSAHGQYFADQTPLGIATKVGRKIAGLEHVSMADIPVRCNQGNARSSSQISAALEVEVKLARSMQQHALVHIVHGSKTGLILPDLAHIDYLQSKWGDRLTFVVDACQARITSQALRDYLERGIIVLMTGSKFMGGAPFNGFAILPSEIMEKLPHLPPGLATIFNRAELPGDWPGRDILPDGKNPGLQLRLDAAIFELERFQALGLTCAERVIDAFENAIDRFFLNSLDVELVHPYAPGESEEAVTHPIEMRTLKTIGISRIDGMRSFEDARQVHLRLARSGIRLGQPVKCVRLSDGGWGGTLRIGLSMPKIVELARLDDEELFEVLQMDMQRISREMVAERVS